MDDDFLDGIKRFTPSIDAYKSAMKSPDELNNSSYCQAIFDDIKSGEDHYLNHLESQYQAVISQLDLDTYSGLIGRGSSIGFGNKTKNVLDVLHEMLSYGLYPPPELLLCISDCYTAYLNAEGKVNLEALLTRVKPRKGKGNYAKRGAIKLNYEYFEEVFNISVGASYPDGTVIYENQTQAAEDYLRSIGRDDTDPESFLRAWRAWRGRGNK
jgi:hypothetical protein